MQCMVFVVICNSLKMMLWLLPAVDVVWGSLSAGETAGAAETAAAVESTLKSVARFLTANKNIELLLCLRHKRQQQQTTTTAIATTTSAAEQFQPLGIACRGSGRLAVFRTHLPRRCFGVQHLWNLSRRFGLRVTGRR